MGDQPACGPGLGTGEGTSFRAEASSGALDILRCGSPARVFCGLGAWFSEAGVVFWCCRLAMASGSPAPRQVLANTQGELSFLCLSSIGGMC